MFRIMVFIICLIIGYSGSYLYDVMRGIRINSKKNRRDINEECNVRL